MWLAWPEGRKAQVLSQLTLNWVRFLADPGGPNTITRVLKGRKRQEGQSMMGNVITEGLHQPGFEDERGSELRVAGQARVSSWGPQKACSPANTWSEPRETQCRLETSRTA